MRKAISSGKINLIREAIIMDISKSPYLHSEIVSFVLGKIAAQDLWNDFSRGLINIKEKMYWNNQYSTQLKKDLKVNFTEENLKHFAEVLQMLLEQKEFDKQAERESTNSNQKKNGEQTFWGFVEQAFNVQKEIMDAQREFISNFRGMERNKQSIKEEIKKRESNSDVDLIYKNSRKR